MAAINTFHHSLFPAVSSQPEHDDASVPTSWLDDVTAKLVFAIIGVCFIVVAALQFTCLVLRWEDQTSVFKFEIGAVNGNFFGVQMTSY